MTPDRHQLGAVAPRVIRLAGGAGLVALAITIVLALVDGDATRFFRSYLVALLFVLTIPLGGLFFTIVQHLTRAGWSVALRRLMEGLAANLQWLWILFIPILVLVISGRADGLFPWLDHAHHDHALEHKAPYLNAGFWIVRAILFFGIWAFLSRFFFRNSVAQDASGDVRYTHAMQRLAPVAMIMYALTQTFAAFDWAMSLSPHWFSTIFGVYFFAGTCCAFFSSLILLVFFLQRQGKLENEVTLEHYQDVGKLLFGFGVAFWGYIGFSQFMLIWYANIPEETTWWIARTQGPWRTFTWLLFIGHFCIPFVVLITKHTKRHRIVIAGIAVYMLVMHALDMYWLVMPLIPDALHHATSLQALGNEIESDPAMVGFTPHLMDVTCLLGLLGLLVAGTAYQLRRCSLIPVRDPRLSESLAFENM
ncbi:MAG: quinol:cytochrome C oxidoreductase [Phycisphaerales bacterium]|nr:quinol:cytochrome C oxidoreductase [Phycisphaerales bacterium]